MAYPGPSPRSDKSGRLPSPTRSSRTGTGNSSRNKIPQADAKGSISLDDLRAALRAEFNAILDNGCLRVMMREEVAAALQEPAPTRSINNGSSSLQRAVNGVNGSNGYRTKVVSDQPREPVLASPCDDDDYEIEADYVAHALSQASGREPIGKKASQESTQAGEVFTEEIKKINQLGKTTSNEPTESFKIEWQGFGADCWRQCTEKADRWYTSWTNLEEPFRKGRLAEFASSQRFETLVCTVIVANCITMTIVADQEISNIGHTPSWHLTLDWIFQIFYTAELLLKLCVHRQFFFANSHWKVNSFDLFLVTVGFFTLFGDGSVSGGFLRSFRVFKFGKVLRTVKVLSRFKHLYAFLLCIQGSLSSFFWSVVMLCIVFFIFSLMIVQLVAIAAADTGTLADHTEDLFGSVTTTMLTLFKSATGGDDWSIAYDAVSETGFLGGFVFLLFISFTQLALINIITGIFVDSAMMSLSPTAEEKARNCERQNSEYAEELRSLCHQVDHDHSGKLTPEQFEDGIRRGRIPLLLMLLGLSKPQVIELFRNMSRQAKDDEGQVDIDVFVEWCMQLKGPTTIYDMQWFRAEMLHARDQQLSMLKDIREQVQADALHLHRRPDRRLKTTG